MYNVCKFNNLVFLVIKFYLLLYAIERILWRTIGFEREIYRPLAMTITTLSGTRPCFLKFIFIFYFPLQLVQHFSIGRRFGRCRGKKQHKIKKIFHRWHRTCFIPYGSEPTKSENSGFWTYIIISNLTCTSWKFHWDGKQ